PSSPRAREPWRGALRAPQSVGTSTYSLVVAARTVPPEGLTTTFSCTTPGEPQGTVPAGGPQGGEVLRRRKPRVPNSCGIRGTGPANSAMDGADHGWVSRGH